MKLLDGKIKLFDRVEISGESGDGDPYLTRWRIIDSPWFGIFMHKMHRPDATPILHDHPWPFISLVLKGGYVERCRNMSRLAVYPDDPGVDSRHIKRVNFKGLQDAHYITRLDRTPSWTLVFVGRTSRIWGYWERVGSTQAIMLTTGEYLRPGTWYRTEWRQHRNHFYTPHIVDPFVNDGE